MDIASAFSLMLPHAEPPDRKLIEEVLQSHFPQLTLQFAASKGIQIHALSAGQKYDEASPALKRMGLDVDSWPSPPAGLFVVEERTLYIKSRSRMTIVHEFGHALDCAIGDGTYHSGVNPEIRKCFADAPAFVTPYAATGLDEYFAESLRAFVEANDELSPWPKATRARLKRIDPTMDAIIEKLLAEIAERMLTAQT